MCSLRFPVVACLPCCRSRQLVAKWHIYQMPCAFNKNVFISNGLLQKDIPKEIKNKCMLLKLAKFASGEFQMWKKCDSNQVSFI